jgi:hypothetical protein
MLTAGVEVEGLLNDHYDPKMPPPPEMRQSIDEVFRLIEEHCMKGQTTIDGKSLERIRSSLGFLKSAASARNKLKSLTAQSIVRVQDVEAWDFVRNKSAHAVASETKLSQDNTLRLDRVLVLFHHLIFHLIGYRGIYSDYGELGYPEKEYPPQ